MTIPQKLKILGFDWTVEDHKDIAYQGNCYGSTHMGSQKIFLDPDTTEQKKQQVLIHEIMHAIWWQMGFSQTYKDSADKNLEEDIITTISQGLYQVFNDNDMLR